MRKDYLIIPPGSAVILDILLKNDRIHELPFTPINQDYWKRIDELNLASKKMSTNPGTPHAMAIGALLKQMVKKGWIDVRLGKIHEHGPTRHLWKPSELGVMLFLQEIDFQDELKRKLYEQDE